jgi:hypothetical protein
LATSPTAITHNCSVVKLLQLVAGDDADAMPVFFLGAACVPLAYDFPSIIILFFVAGRFRQNHKPQHINEVKVR